MDQKKGERAKKRFLYIFFSFFFVLFPYPQYLPKERRASIEQTK